jgi:hypothetical protein
VCSFGSAPRPSNAKSAAAKIRERPSIAKAASAPALRGPAPTRDAPRPASPASLAATRGRAVKLAREAKTRREGSLAAADAFLTDQMNRMGLSSADVDLEKKHRYAQALERPSRDALAKSAAPAPAATSHLRNHERLLEKYRKSLVPSRAEPDLLGDRSPLSPDKTPYRALAALEAFHDDDSCAPPRGSLVARRESSLGISAFLTAPEPPGADPAAGEDWIAARFGQLVPPC